MEAATLRCPGCGAAAGKDLDACSHCGARLATVACPSCFGRIFRGTAHCPHCGARAARADVADEGRDRLCPRCAVRLDTVRVGHATVRECPRCSGLWLTPDTVTEVTTDAESQSAVLRFAQPPADGGEPSVRYVPCPECGELMHRTNFQRISGVIIDQCRHHGAWFDRDELRRVVEFIRRGGLDVARGREMLRLEEERKRLVELRREYGATRMDVELPKRTRAWRGKLAWVAIRMIGRSLWDV